VPVVGGVYAGGRSVEFRGGGMCGRERLVSEASGAEGSGGAGGVSETRGGSSERGFLPESSPSSTLTEWSAPVTAWSYEGGRLGLLGRPDAGRTMMVRVT
jgi:hypothetical protein